MGNPWSRFAVGTPGEPGGLVAPDCRPLYQLSHIAHLPVALRIVEDGAIRAGLISDESRLRDQRISVSWLSPNDWTGAGGSRYGHIRFRFDPKELLDGHNAYWVEVMEHDPPASRILITDIDRSDQLEPYNPGDGEGPWWRTTEGQHYWNGRKHCLEFMFEGDVALDRAGAVDFILHHPQRCSLLPAPCKYRQESGPKVGARFIAALAARRAQFAWPGLYDAGGIDSSVKTAIDYLLRACAKQVCSADPGEPRDDKGHALARAVLSAYANDLSPDMAALSGLFGSPLELQSAVLEVLAKELGIDDPGAVGLGPLVHR